VAAAVLNAGLPEQSLPTLLGDLATGNIAGLSKIPGVTTQVLAAAGEAVPLAFTKSYQVVYLTSLVFGGVAIIFASLVDGKAWAARMTSEVARQLQPSSILHARGSATHDDSGAEKGV
jgi:hypothetical protein